MWALVSLAGHLRRLARPAGLVRPQRRGRAVPDRTCPGSARPPFTSRSVNGISLWLVLLSTFLTPICVLVSWNSIDHRVQGILRLPAPAGIRPDRRLLALDLFLFYVFWEVCAGAHVLPDRHLGPRPPHLRRRQVLPLHHGRIGPDAGGDHLPLQQDPAPSTTRRFWRCLQSGTSDASAASEQMLLFLAFFIAFAIKVPLFPLHTWLPDAHVEAPTAGSIMLASRHAENGHLRTAALLPAAVPQRRARLRRRGSCVLAIIGIVYGALVALVQPNMKKLVAYSSVSHLGFVVLGIFSLHPAGTRRRGVPDAESRHLHRRALPPGRLSSMSGVIRSKSSAYGGVATPAPRLATVFLITTLASIGLPMLNNFVGEYPGAAGTAHRQLHAGPSSPRSA